MRVDKGGMLTYDYAIVRVVPRVERGEFINVGAIVCCARRDFLDARIELDQARLRSIDPNVDIEAIAANLATIPLICAGGPPAGPIGRLSVRERFDWLVAPRSTVIQTAAVHIGRGERLDHALEHLLERMVRPASRPPGSRPG